MRRNRQAKIVATIGPSSSSREQIRALFEAGADVFRLNFSHGTHEDHAARYQIIRELEKEFGRPIGVMQDLQGPKLRVGRLDGGKVHLQAGQRFEFVLQECLGNCERISLPHPEIFAVLQAGADLLLDDGKLHVKVEDCNPRKARVKVLAGGVLSDHKGVNLPGTVLPISPLTEKDLKDLAFGLDLGVDWVALSFVQRPEDIDEAKRLIGARAWVVAKLEKPSAIEHLQAIVSKTDGVMVARGDLGVELPQQKVPPIQRRIVKAARQAGKPVIVATQMLESMITSPVPTRAESSDVATAIYEGADAVMLSAESASGQYPVQAVLAMNSIITEIEADPSWRTGLDALSVHSGANISDAICQALRDVSRRLPLVSMLAYTSSGKTAMLAARERPSAPILGLTPSLEIARRLALVWGVHAVPNENVHNVDEMIEHAVCAAIKNGFARKGDHIAVTAGIPFGRSGTTNLLHVTQC